MEALLHQRSVRLWVAPGNVGSRTRLSRGLSGCTPSQIQRILLHALDGSQRLCAWALSLMRSFGSANVQRSSSSFCHAATSGGSNEPQIWNLVSSALPDLTPVSLKPLFVFLVSLMQRVARLSEKAIAIQSFATFVIHEIFALPPLRHGSLFVPT